MSAPAAGLPRPVGILGVGRVGAALAAWLHARAVPLHLADTVPGARARALAARGLPLHVGDAPPWLPHTSLLVLALPDGTLDAAARRLPGLAPGTVVLHCAGALPGDHLRAALPPEVVVGSWHPVHAFADRAPGSPRGVPVAIDGEPAARAAGEALAALLGMHPFALPAEGRALYHAGLALASNGAVGLGAGALDLLAAAGVPAQDARRMVARLLRQAATNLAETTPERALTGPVQRGDEATLARHRAAVAARVPAELPFLDAVVTRLRRLVAGEGAA